jgi:cyanate lyase
MAERATERRELERKLLRAMKAKWFSFRTLAAETGLSSFIATAALLGQMSLPKEVVALTAIHPKAELGDSAHLVPARFRELLGRPRHQVDWERKHDGRTTFTGDVEQCGEVT